MRFLPGFLSKLLLAAGLACVTLLAAAETQPPRLSLVEGAVSFWRPGAPDWVEARINTPLAIGDALYAGPHARLELELWGGGFVRAADEAQLTLVNQTREYLQLSTTSGRLALDFSDLPSGYVVEVDTPHAVFTIERPGYYRVDVGAEGRFLVQERGAATLTLADGTRTPVRSGDEVVVAEGREPVFYAAPPPDAWDEWNFDRSEELADSRSERYLPPGVAGAAELDRYGEWQVVQEYGPLWAPHSIPSGWVPYSSGRWIWDPHYQWTWVDDAPWGWAPFHYGRWVNVGGHWMWAPGAGRQAVYAPALVGFMGASGGPNLGWVALGWGEPVYPWWGHSGFVGQPWWGGWGGPRVDHHHHHKGSRKEAFNPRKMQYVNARTPNAIVTTAREHFGRGHVNPMMHPNSATRNATRNAAKNAAKNMVPLQGKLPVKPAPERMIGDVSASVRPPDQLLVKPVVATRAAQPVKLPWNVRQPALAQQRLVPGALDARRATSRPESREARSPAEQARQLRGMPAPSSNVVIPGRSAVTPQRELEPSRPQIARPSSRNASPTVVPGRAESSRPDPAAQEQQAPADYRGKTRGALPGIAPNPVLENARSGRFQQERLDERRVPPVPGGIGRPEEPGRGVETVAPRPADRARELLAMPPATQPSVPRTLGPPVTVPQARTLPSGMNPPLLGVPPARTPSQQQGTQDGGEPQGLRPPSSP